MYRLIRILSDEIFDPTLNISLEHSLGLCSSVNKYYGTVRFWQNDKSIIIGRFQLLENEVNVDYCKENNIKILRRISSGGAVYNDLGNYNISFIFPFSIARELNIELNVKELISYYSNVIKRSLENLGFSNVTYSNGSIFWNGQKISGSAQYVKNNYLLHHCTLLLNADLNNLEKALINKGNIDYKHKSIYSPTVNLTDLDINMFKSQIITLISNDFDQMTRVGNLTNKERVMQLYLLDNMYTKETWNLHKKTPKLVYSLDNFIN
jgi:lipoate---protein ligase